MLRLRVCENCHLRPLEEADCDELHALIERNRGHLRPWMPWADQDLAATQGFIRAAVQQSDEEGMHLAIVCHGAIAGVVGTHGIDPAQRSTSLGYWLDEAHQGLGLMTRAVRALVDHAVRTWALDSVEIRAATDNTRSRAIAERLGFGEEGVLPEALQVGDRDHDLVVYVLRQAPAAVAAEQRDRALRRRAP